jgi:HEPN domain-containing protein
MSLEKQHKEALDPNGLPDLTPGEVYLKRDADLCIRCARAILTSVKPLIKDS